MAHREHFMAVMRGADKSNLMPFFPDITDWYSAQRCEPGMSRVGGYGTFLSDAHPVHKVRGSMPDAYADWTLLDFYRRFNWGLPIHLYRWYHTELVNGVELATTNEPGERITRLRTSKGELVRRDRLAADGSWCPVEHFCKEPRDLEIIREMVDATRYSPNFGRVQAAMDEMGGQGIGDLPIHRSPFGKVVHEYLGFEQTAYALFEEEAYIKDFLAFQEQKDLELIRLATQAPAPIVILSDHADEILISPPQYKTYCIPFYQKAVPILHAAGKLVSTHLDGNFKGFFPILAETGFDLLDGCTPAPMFNYEVEELAAALPSGMKAYCGVPATLFCQHLPTQDILAFGDRITTALKGRAILNVGDILPPDGDIAQVVALGKHIQETA